MKNGISHRYHLDECTFFIGASGVIFFIFISFFDEIPVANRIAPDGTPPSAASHLGAILFAYDPLKGCQA